MATKQRAQRAKQVPGGRKAMRRVGAAIAPLSAELLDQVCAAKGWTQRRVLEAAIELYHAAVLGNVAAVRRAADGAPTPHEVLL